MGIRGGERISGSLVELWMEFLFGVLLGKRTVESAIVGKVLMRPA